MALMEIHKHADYSGDDPDPVDNRTRADGTIAKRQHAWPLSHVEVKSTADQHVFARQFVDKAVAAGWMEFAGKPLSYEIFPDPVHPDTKFATNRTETLPGDHLVLHVVDGDELVDLTYKIVSPPVPQEHWRVKDDNEPSGFAAPHQYDLELEDRQVVGPSPHVAPISGGSGVDQIFNISLGALAEEARSDATKFLVILLKTVESDALMKDRATVATVVANSTEADFTNSGRKTGITATLVVDNTLDRVTLDTPDQTWVAAGGASNNTVHKLVFAYEKTAADSGRVPGTAHSFEVTTDGSDLTAQINDFIHIS